jgi:hypothetical protein
MTSESSNASFLQCLGACAQHIGSWGGRRHDRSQKENRQRWIAVEELDEENLPEDCGHLLALYRAWLEGNY